MINNTILLFCLLLQHLMASSNPKAPLITATWNQMDSWHKALIAQKGQPWPEKLLVDPVVTPLWEMKEYEWAIADGPTQKEKNKAHSVKVLRERGPNPSILRGESTTEFLSDESEAAASDHGKSNEDSSSDSESESLELSTSKKRTGSGLKPKTLDRP